VYGDGLGLALILVRNGLLVAASLTAARRLWRQTVTEPHLREQPPSPQPTRDETLLVS
jgi:hypothetical protein